MTSSLDRRHFLATTATTVALNATPLAAAEDETARLNAWLEDRFATWTARSPMTQGYLGLSNNMDQWDDISESHQAEDLELAKKDLADLTSTFDPATLDEEGRLSFRLYAYEMQKRIDNFAWRRYEYPVNQMFGWQQEIPSFLINIHRVETKEQAEAYIARLRGVPALMEGVLAIMGECEAAGVLPPKFVFDHVLRDCRNVIVGAPYDAAGKDSTLLEDFRGKVTALQLDDAEKQQLIADVSAALNESLKPAFDKLIALCEQQKSRANTNDGAWKHPKGAAYYAHKLKYHTTTAMTANQIHNFGLSEVARIHGEMRAIMQQVNFEGDLQAFFKHLRESPEFYYPDTPEGKAAYLARSVEIVDAMRAHLDDVFLTKPKAQLVVKAVEPFREQSSTTAFYQGPGAFDGRPGIYYVNTFDMRAQGKYEMEALAYHEAIPGHHMQIAIAQEIEGLPSFRKFWGDYTAYIEGWGLYCERLPKEMGFYQDPYSDFGRLSMELLRACRLVVDTGLHAVNKKWSREKAIQYLKDNSPNADSDIINSVERYIVMPGQATAYKIGMTKIYELRDDAKKRLGLKFNIREYHDVVLTKGSLPLDILAENVEAWVRQKLA